MDEHDVGYGVDGYRGSFVLDTAAQRSGIHSLRILDDADDPAGEDAARGRTPRGRPRGGRGALRDARDPRSGRRGPGADRHGGRARFGDGRSNTAVHGPGARRIGVGPGFGGGVDGVAASHAVQLTQRACGIDFGVLGGWAPRRRSRRRRWWTTACGCTRESRLCFKTSMFSHLARHLADLPSGSQGRLSSPTVLSTVHAGPVLFLLQMSNIPSRSSCCTWRKGSFFTTLQCVSTRIAR